MSIYQFNEIRKIHLEISSKCNAACPLCPRNFHGYPYNEGYVEHNMTIDEAATIFTPSFLSQIKEIHINGNFGDIVMNPDAIDIIRYFRQHTKNPLIHISTNGGARDNNFWQELASTGAQVYFCIDGLEDTHHLYRQNTLYSTVIKNASTFIKAGGEAYWKMIKFDHNQHQRDQARELSQHMGFRDFVLVYDGRDQGPVFDRLGQIVHWLGKRPDREPDFDRMLSERESCVAPVNSVVAEPRPIRCEVARDKSIYVTAIGEVYPCCYLGFNPRTYGRASFMGAVNSQLKPLLGENNALKRPLKECIEWFDRVAETWNIPTFEQGRLLQCNTACGGNSTMSTYEFSSN